jgi:hypothetical protein
MLQPRFHNYLDQNIPTFRSRFRTVFAMAHLRGCFANATPHVLNVRVYNVEIKSQAMTKRRAAILKSEVVTEVEQELRSVMKFLADMQVAYGRQSNQVEAGGNVQVCLGHGLGHSLTLSVTAASNTCAGTTTLE